MALILSEKDIEPLFDDPAAMDGLLDVIEEVLRAHRRGEIRSQGGTGLPMAEAERSFRLITASLPGAGQVVRINPQSRQAKDAHLNLLFDGGSGDLLALVAGEKLNVWRTGAPAGIAARTLASPGATTVGLLGSGRQARGQLLALRRALPSLRRARVFSPTEAHRAEFSREMSAWLELEVEPAADPRAAVAGAEIVSLATSSRSTVIEAGWISPGALVVSITSGQLPAELVARARVFASWKEEVLHGKPPRQPYAAMIASGNWSEDRFAGELGEVIAGDLPGRQDDSEIIVFESVGMPAWDAATTAWVYRWAIEDNAGTFFSLA